MDDPARKLDDPAGGEPAHERSGHAPGTAHRPQHVAQRVVRARELALGVLRGTGGFVHAALGGRPNAIGSVGGARCRRTGGVQRLLALHQPAGVEAYADGLDVNCHCLCVPWLGPALCCQARAARAARTR